MSPGGRGGDASAGCTGQQPLAYEEGFGHLLDGLPLLPHGHGERGEADGPAAEELEEGFEDTTVEAVEAAAVHFVHREGGPGDVLVDDAVGLDLGVVADPAQQTVGDTRRAPGAAA